MRASEITLWEKDRVLRENVRAEHHLNQEVPPDEVTGYKILVQGMVERKHEDNTELALPCYGTYCTEGDVMSADNSEGKTSRKYHEEREAALGDMSEDFMAMVYTAIPDAKVW